MVQRGGGEVGEGGVEDDACVENVFVYLHAVGGSGVFGVCLCHFGISPSPAHTSHCRIITTHPPAPRPRARPSPTRRPRPLAMLLHHRTAALHLPYLLLAAASSRDGAPGPTPPPSRGTARRDRRSQTVCWLLVVMMTVVAASVVAPRPTRPWRPRRALGVSLCSCVFIRQDMQESGLEASPQRWHQPTTTNNPTNPTHKPTHPAPTANPSSRQNPDSRPPPRARRGGRRAPSPTPPAATGPCCIVW